VVAGLVAPVYAARMVHDSTPSGLDADQLRVLDELASHLGPACRVGVLTGAGISAASGVPTFRGQDGYWKNFRAQDLATPEGFSRDPAVGWEWYGWRRDRIRQARPNAAHHALVDLHGLVGELTILTQNVDGLHALALQRPDGSLVPDGPQIVELHGSIWRMRCFRCRHEREDRRPGPGPEDPLPTCQCGGLLRPGVVWFGESLPVAATERAHLVALRADVFLVVGTSAVVYPAASYASVARHGGAKVAEFNLEATELSEHVHGAVHAPAELTLPALVERVRAHRSGAAA
jgi:NAD-dependent deacetylase